MQRGLKHQVYEQMERVSSRISSVHPMALSVPQEKAILFRANTESFSDLRITLFICVAKYAVLGFLQMSCLASVVGSLSKPWC